MAATLQRSGSSLHRSSSPSSMPSSPAAHRLRQGGGTGGGGGPSRFFERDNTPTAATASSAEFHSTEAAFEELAKDPLFSKFLSDGFDVTVFVSEALRSGSVSACSEKLEDGIRLMERQLKNEVHARHDGLLHLLSSLKDAESIASAVRSETANLQSSVQRVRSEIADPYHQVRIKTRQLTNLHGTTELLRTITRALRQIKKLRDLMEPGNTPNSKQDLAKAAQIYHEIHTLRLENNLDGVTVLDEQIPWFLETGSEIRRETMRTLESGMEALNQAEVGSALQVYYNIGELRMTVESIVGKYKTQTVRNVSIALDMKAVSSNAGVSAGPGGIQRSGTPQIGGSSRAKEALWQRMGVCMDQSHKNVVAVWHLQRVLSKKRDPISHAGFLEEVIQPGDSLLTDRVWEALVKAFTTQMKSAFTASSFVKETFVLGFPKLLAMVENLLDRLVHDTDVKGGVLPAIKSEDKEQLLAALYPFQTAYLAQCLTRLSDLVNSMFPLGVRGVIPSQEQISRIIMRMQEEIEAVKLDGRLMLLVLHEVGKVLQLLAEKAEYQIATGPESRQVTSPATALQIKNITLSLQLQEVHSHMTKILSSLPQAAADIMSPSLGSLYGVAFDSVSPLFQAMVEVLENSILQIHDQNFGSEAMDSNTDNNNNNNNSNGSKYMEEIQVAIVHFRNEFLSKMLPANSSPAVAAAGDSIYVNLTRKMAARVLVFFVRHAALVRPLSESGKLRMARDMAELELVVGQNLFPVEQLGVPYRALRAFKPLIFLETAQLANSPLLQELPPGVILHHLYSGAPPDLESPMKRNKLTPKQYSLWLDSQGEEQIWRGIKATLDDYASRVKARGDKEFTPVYLLMLKLGASLVEKNLA